MLLMQCKRCGEQVAANHFKTLTKRLTEIVAPVGRDCY